jgi:hypothetical protein
MPEDGSEHHADEEPNAHQQSSANLRENQQRRCQVGGLTSPIQHAHSVLCVGPRRTYELKLCTEHRHQAVIKTDVRHLDARTQVRQRRIVYECKDVVRVETVVCGLG